jgi:hypothetical protein
MKGSGIGARGAGALALLRSAWRGRGAKPQAEGRRLTANEREALLQVMRLGCPRSTAAKCVGMDGPQLEGLLAADEELHQEVLRAEAAAEVRHMSNVHKASSDEKNWRTSVWWLEQRGFSELKEAEVDLGYPEAVMTALDKFAELIIAEIPDVMRRQLLLTKLLHIAAESVEAPVVIEGEVRVGEAGGSVMRSDRIESTTQQERLG